MNMRLVWPACLLLPLMGCVLPQVEGSGGQGGLIHDPGASSDFVQRPAAAPRPEQQSYDPSGPVWVNLPEIRKCVNTSNTGKTASECGKVFGCTWAMTVEDCRVEIRVYQREWDEYYQAEEDYMAGKIDFLPPYPRQ